METGWIIVDEFATRFFYFFRAIVFAPQIFALAARVIDNSWTRRGFLLAWALAEGFAVFGGISELPGVSLALGLVGAVAVVSFAALLSKSDLMAAGPLLRPEFHRHLSRLLPADGRVARRLLKFGVIDDLGTISLIVTAAA